MKVTAIRVVRGINCPFEFDRDQRQLVVGLRYLFWFEVFNFASKHQCFPGIITALPKIEPIAVGG